MAMRRLLLTTAIFLGGCNAGLAQVSTMGTTAMGLPTTPATIVTSPLYGPSPFSATTQPNSPGTTLAPVPLASDPTTPGTVVTCATPTGQIAPGTPTVPVISMSATGGAIGTTPSTSAAISTVPATSPTSTTAPLLLSATPATSFITDFPGSTVPVASSPIGAAAPAVTATSTPTPSTVPTTTSTSMAGSTATTMSPTTTMSSLAMMPGTALGTIPTPFVGSTTGTISPVSPPLGSPSTTVCSTTPGGPPTNGAALPLSTPEVPSSPPPGAIQPTVAVLGDTSIDPTTGVMPTPNTSACAESMTMNLATPGTMAPANATGAAATPGVSPASPSGC